MAGDWIKFEHATLDKPEVLRTAEMLGVSRDTAVGIFIRYFVWLDKNLSGLCPGLVRNVSRKSLDEVMHCPGFAACLECVGWATFDDSAWTLSVANADNHNGQSAKSRALDARRKSKGRHADVREMSGSEPDTNRTREEKRRANTSLRDVLEAPSEEHRSLARSLGVDCDEQFQRYRDHFKANGRSHRDQQAGFRNWLRKAADFADKKRPAGREPSLAEKRAANVAAMTGQTRHVIDITARMDTAALPAHDDGVRKQIRSDVG